MGTPLGAEFVNGEVSPLADEANSVLYVGRLAAEKNIDISWPWPRRARTAASPWPATALRGLVEQRQKDLPNLNFLGWCSRERVVAELDAHQVLVLPSAVEAFGTVALEALARERMVITTPVCGINQWPALARALTVAEADEPLADTLARLQAMTPAQRREQARAGREAALAMNGEAVDGWLQVLQGCARQGAFLPKPRRSPTLAVLRRLSTNQARPGSDMALSGLVSIHDVMPETRDRVAELLERLADVPPAAVTLLVVPGRDWSGDDLDWLRDLSARATRSPATAGDTAATRRAPSITACTACSFPATWPSTCPWMAPASPP